MAAVELRSWLIHTERTVGAHWGQNLTEHREGSMTSSSLDEETRCQFPETPFFSFPCLSLLFLPLVAAQIQFQIFANIIHLRAILWLSVFHGCLIWAPSNVYHVVGYFMSTETFSISFHIVGYFISKETFLYTVYLYVVINQHIQSPKPFFVVFNHIIPLPTPHNKH